MRYTQNYSALQRFTNASIIKKTKFSSPSESWIRVGLTPILIAIATAAMSCAQQGSAATLLVYNNNDAGSGSLRQALQDNGGLGGGNTILFSNIVTGTITLGSTLNITADVTILGPGAKVLTVNGNNSLRVFAISGGAVSISGLTIANGAALFGNGGGILSSPSGGFSPLTIQGCVFSNNIAGGAGAGDGGALYMQNQGTILNSTFYGNHARGNGSGGAIYDWGLLLISNCTFTANSATNTFASRGGAIFAFNLTGDTSIYGCTIVSNNAGATGGGVQRYQSSTRVGNNIIAGNYAPTGPDTSDVFFSSGYNLIGNAGGSTGWTGVGDQVGSSGSPLNPLLGLLQNNGGPTPTMAPLPGSPAIDQGKSSGNAIDQRGRPRPYDNPAILNATGGDGTDIGAVEISPITLIVSNANDSGAASLRQTILDASDSDTISFASNVTGRITLTNGELLIDKSLSIAGPGASTLAVSGNSSNRVFEILSGNVSLSGLTICDGRVANSVGSFEQNGAAARGGGIFNQANLTIRDCIVSNNAVVGGQGGPTDSGFAGNGGNGLGGGILNISTLAMLRCSLVSNSAAGGLGGVATAGGSDGMGGQGFGGGLYTFGAALLTNCVLHGSSALGGAGNAGSGSGSGGAIDNEMSLGLYNCTVANNQSVGSPFDFGGGIFDNGTQLLLRNCTVSSNQTDFGGGISSGNADLGNTILAGNNAGSGPDCSGTINSSDYNLIQNNSGCTFSGTTTHNLLGQNPLLGPLTENGGPTRTMALLSGSPAIDKGKNFGFTADQRGMLRPLDFPSIPNAGGGDASDIGAFEYWPPSPQLTIQRANTNVLLSWPTNAAGFRLQSVSNLLAVNNWSNASGSPSIIGTQFYLTNPIPAARTFYRLVFP